MPDFDPSKLIDPLKDERNDVHIYRASDVLSYIVNRYIDTYDDFVFKDGTGKYVFAKTMSDANIRTAFSMFFTELVNSNKFTMGNKKTFIVSGGFPFMNWKTSQFDEIKVESSRKIIKTQMFLNYVMTDRQIKIDEVHLCNVWNTWSFNLMSNQEELNDMLNLYDGVHFLCNKHSNEDDYIDVVTKVFGPSRVTLMDLDIVKSISELNKFVFKDLVETEIPMKIVSEGVQYLKLILNQPDDDV